MQITSARKLSILGLVLMAASAVTAAVIPGKSDKKDVNKFQAGSITEGSALNDNEGSSVTCAPDTLNNITAPCNASSQDGLSQTTVTGGTSNNSVSSTEGDGNNNTTSSEE